MRLSQQKVSKRFLVEDAEVEVVTLLAEAVKTLPTSRDNETEVNMLALTDV
jgi:hypothetical protein